MNESYLNSNYKFVSNSISPQNLYQANQLRIETWNNVINQLSTQSNNTTRYLQYMHEWLFGTNFTLTYTSTNTTGFLNYLKTFSETLRTEFNIERNRAQTKDADLQTQINTLNTNLANEVSRATTKEAELDSKDASLQTQIDTEVSRAKGKEKDLNDWLTRITHPDSGIYATSVRYTDSKLSTKANLNLDNIDKIDKDLIPGGDTPKDIGSESRVWNQIWSSSVNTRTINVSSSIKKSGHELATEEQLKGLHFTLDENFVLRLFDKDGNQIGNSVDFPSESAIVGIEYIEKSEEGKVKPYLKIILQNNNTSEIPLSRIISGLATEQYVNDYTESYCINDDDVDEIIYTFKHGGSN